MAVSNQLDLRNKLEANRADLIKEVTNLPEAAIGRRPTEGEWSVREILAHIPGGERAMLACVLEIRDKDNPEVRLGDHATHDSTMADRSIDEILTAMTAARAETLTTLNNLTEEQLARTGRFPEWGELSALQMLRAIYRHDREHVEQIQALRKTLAL